MAYLIKPDEPAEEAVRRLLLEQNQRALELLQNWREDPARHIHRTRQTCKKIRALLRLIKPAVRYVYTVENHFYRDIQRSLAYARDAQAMVEALDVLAEELTDPLPLQSLQMLKTALSQRATMQTRVAAESLTGRIEAAAADLSAAGDRLAGLPLDGLRRRDLRRGAQRSLSRCAREFHQLRQSDPAVAFHEWRKPVKYAWYQQRLLRELMPEQSAALCQPLETLAAVLGQSQDLTVLDDFLQAQPDALGVDTHLRRLRSLIVTAQQGLRERAEALGEELFGSAGDQPDRVSAGR